ncbi:MAG: formylglycine-generating enzyme family protein [Acidobacteria bacterium]|nr:formylglycine-generating enzyme family protein [Acidobacteriota bacterium]
MKKLTLTAIIILLVFGAGGVWFAARYIRGDWEEKTHFEQGETKLTVVNLANAPMRLFKAGKKFADAAEIKEFNGQAAWLSRGNYFLQVELPARTTFYPIPIAGYRLGPDADGSFAVTIRSLTANAPPQLMANLPEWAYIPSGNFLIGDRQNPREPHYVWLPAFCVSAFETTNAEFRQFQRDPQGYANPDNWTAAGKRWKAETQSQATALLKESDAEFHRFGQDDQPVAWVTWFEAAAFCKWLTNKLGQDRWLFSLPSEAEWEKAARGPDSFDFALSPLLSDEESRLYNWKKNPGAPETVIGIEMTKVRFQPNRYGIFHLSGNVVEWTQTINRSYNRERRYTDDDGRNREDLTEARVARGGSWYSASIALLSIAYRDAFQPEVRHHDLGFRIVAKPLP